jgi:asparagine synthase (glutamine-hydrolysing)
MSTRPDRRPASIAPLLGRMLATMEHRGPDDEAVRVAPGIGLGFRRLSIRDLDGGRQPMTGERERVWSVFNGELYNYAELHASLAAAGHVFHTTCDAEVIPHLYEEVGLDEMLRRLRGMFALALYDSADHTLHVARDPFGIKPLYVAETPDGVYVASQAETIIAAGVPADVDPMSVWHYLTYQYVPGPRTMYRAVRQVPPSHRISYRAGQREEAAYTQMAFDPDPTWTLERAAPAVRAVLEDSVARHLVSDVPVGAYLSGGIDSSAVVALMRHHQAVDTFSIGFEGATPDRDELPRAGRTARALGTRHHEVRIGARDYRDRWEAIVRFQGDPVADPSAPALYFLAEEARRHVKVVLSGEGADELFAGYAIYHEPLSVASLDRLPPGVRRAIRRAAAALPRGMRGRSFLERGTTPLPERFLGNARIFTEPEKHALFRDGLVPPDVLPSWALTADVYAETASLHPTTRMQTVDVRFWLAGDILMKADKMSMAHSLEQRVPYLDPEVFRVARRIPARVELVGGTFKRVLRAAVADLLPDEITRQPKLGFPVPIGRWLRGDLYPLAQDLVESSSEPFLRRERVRALLDQRVRSAPEDRRLWTVLTYLMWHRVFVEQRDYANRRSVAPSPSAALAESGPLA